MVTVGKELVVGLGPGLMIDLFLSQALLLQFGNLLLGIPLTL